MPTSENAAESAWNRRHLAVPRYDGGLLIEPSCDVALELAAENHRLAGSEMPVCGEPLSELRSQTRQAVFLQASAFTRQIGGESEEALSDRQSALLFVGGHQPSLHHPGVWLKNFVTGDLARAAEGIGLNLIVDNDVASSRAIRVPFEQSENWRWQGIPFDDPAAPQPWEEATIQNAEVFDRFGTQAAAAMQRLGVESGVEQYWAAAVAHRRSGCDCLVECLAAARHQWEMRHGLHNLEFPLSQLCELPMFRQFVLHILEQLPDWQNAYNKAVAEYRHVNRVRSRNHPVPNLERRGDWLEAPFWVWEPTAQRRERLFARATSDGLELAAGETSLGTVPDRGRHGLAAALDALEQLSRQGIRLRSRALTTTMFSRLCIADMFLHGIGGAKYDEMTDRLIERCFGLSAPAFMTVTGTLLLPMATRNFASADELARLKQQSRDLEFNPDRNLSGDDVDASAANHVAGLIAEKRQIQAEQLALKGQRNVPRPVRRKQRAENIARYRRFREINRQLGEFVSDQRRRIADEIDRLEKLRQDQSIHSSRELPACLYPEERLANFLTRAEESRS